MALIVGLGAATAGKMAIIGSLIGSADNLTASRSVHIGQEAEGLAHRQAR